MDSLTTICEPEIPLQMQNIDAFTVSFAKSLESLRATAQQTARYQGLYLHSIHWYASLSSIRVLNSLIKSLFTLLLSSSGFHLYSLIFPSVQLEEVKGKLKEVEDDLVKVLAGQSLQLALISVSIRIAFYLSFTASNNGRYSVFVFNVQSRPAKRLDEWLWWMLLPLQRPELKTSTQIFKSTEPKNKNITHFYLNSLWVIQFFSSYLLWKCEITFFRGNP